MAGVLDLGSAARQACDCLGCDRGLMIKQHGIERRYSVAKRAELRTAMSSRSACRFRMREPVMNHACPSFVLQNEAVFADAITPHLPTRPCLRH